MCRLVRAVVDQYNEYHKLGEVRSPSFHTRYLCRY
jgi:hypothetical protein